MSVRPMKQRNQYTMKLREALAELEHTRWAHWQKYLHSHCIANPDGSLTIPAELVQHWQQQIYTKYADLTEPEKDKDRKEADQTLDVLSRFGAG